MFAKERQDKIVEKINKEGSIKVKELALEFEVTQDLIRKDLSLLERAGELTKTYGGAMVKREITHNFGVDNRVGVNSVEKQQIANNAYDFIEAGMTIFLDITTINIELAKKIKENKKDVTVVTNMIDVLLTLLHSDIKVIFLGGTLNRTEKGFIGSQTIHQIENFQFDLSFIGTVGVDIENDRVYTYTSEDGLTKAAIIKHSHDAYVVLEDAKLEKDGTYSFVEASNCTGLITEYKTITNNNK